ncbi:MAG: response regulator [Jaaginema sp. PMC 1079.18]|nr:response regulator [Jaaginema sp. PMC 1080.18]MEC4849653.1 response regulator [Jaaginema sp. PMC 1079.18]MEC4866087.1 response regulator [Jaaginema sp. PMC 1078.18]
MRILLVEDDDGFAAWLETALTQQHYLIERAGDGQTAWDLAEAFPYDLILLDWLLPKLDGLEFCRQLRRRGDFTPILLMTAQDSNAHKVKGLDAGADDFLVKPFALEELLARIRALLRRGNTPLWDTMTWGQLQLDPANCQVTYGGIILKLTAKEYELLELFLRNPSRIFSQSTLLDRLWSFDDPPSEGAVRTQIKSLRRKLKKAGAPDIIETVYGLGYRLKENSAPPEQPVLDPTIAAIWERHRPKYRDRLAAIERAIAALTHNHLTPELQATAQQEAHTLAGSLGSFGFSDASIQARTIETQLQRDRPQLDDLAPSLDILRQVLTVPNLSPPVTSETTPLPTPRSGHILIVDDDVVLAQAIAQAAQKAGFTADITANPSLARTYLAHCRPDVVLLDLTFAETAETGFELLTELQQNSPAIPAIAFTAKESFRDRVKVARLGGCGFLHKPVSPARAIEAIDRILNQTYTPTATLLIVDDDAQLLDYLSTLLQPWGFKVTLLSDPQQFWQTLETAQPDLLILDIFMPEVNGIELCQVVRNDLQWGELPILMLSAHRETEIVQQVFWAGADDYIQKPIVAPELIARVLNRLERYRMQHLSLKF